MLSGLAQLGSAANSSRDFWLYVRRLLLPLSGFQTNPFITSLPPPDNCKSRRWWSLSSSQWTSRSPISSLPPAAATAQFYGRIFGHNRMGYRAARKCPNWIWNLIVVWGERMSRQQWRMNSFPWRQRRRRESGLLRTIYANGLQLGWRCSIIRVASGIIGIFWGVINFSKTNSRCAKQALVTFLIIVALICINLLNNKGNELRFFT